MQMLGMILVTGKELNIESESTVCKGYNLTEETGGKSQLTLMVKPGVARALKNLSISIFVKV